MISRVWVCGALLVACGKGGTETVESSVNHVRFTIQLPKGWKRDVDTELIKGWRPDVADYTRAPSITVGYVQQPPQNLDSYIQSLHFEGTPIIDKKDMTGDYLVVVSHTADHGIVKVDAMSHKGATHIGCSAFQMTPGGVPHAEATAEWLEKLCRSLVIE